MRKNILSISCIVLALFFSRHKLVALFKSTKVPGSIYLEAGCKGKKMCGLVYLAPWCPACNSAIPMLKTFLLNSKKNAEFGLLIIVGNGQSPGDNAKKASEIGEDVITDNNNQYAHALNIRYFPTFLVVDSKSIVKYKDQKGAVWMNKAFGP